MDRTEYEIMYRLEDDYWWYRGLHELLLSFLNGLSRAGAPVRVLDAGCGTGRFLECCAGHSVQGVEISEEALEFVRSRGLDCAIQGSVCALPFEDQTFECVVSADVLCHMGAPQDMKALEEMRRVLKKGGTLLLHLPAHPFLSSRHDRAVHNLRRYRKAEARSMLAQAGFEIQRLTYRNTALFPPAAMVRALGKIGLGGKEKPKSDLTRLPDPLNRLLTGILRMENRLLRSGVDLPFGLSIFCVARRPG